MTFAASQYTPMAQITKLGAQLTGFHINDIKSQRRSKELCWARFGVIWAIRRSTIKSLPDIGRFLNGRDHTTIIHALRRAETLRSTDDEFLEYTDLLAGIPCHRLATAADFSIAFGRKANCTSFEQLASPVAELEVMGLADLGMAT